jgi:cytochrome b561
MSDAIPHTHTRFSPLQRALHWTMAAMVLAMLFIGIGMVSTVHPGFLTLIGIHRPLGIAILVLALVRLATRLRRGSPPLPADLPAIQKLAALASHLLLYALMILMPLIGWGMLSAGGLPVVMAGSLHLPPILPVDPLLYARLRVLHSVLAYLFFATILLHLAAALFHGLIRRDGVLESMAGDAGAKVEAEAALR